MTKTEKLINDYWFENFYEFIETLRRWEREDENNNLFFENAIWCVDMLYTACKHFEQENEKLKQENQDYFEQYETKMYNTD